LIGCQPAQYSGVPHDANTPGTVKQISIRSDFRICLRPLFNGIRRSFRPFKRDFVSGNALTPEEQCDASQDQSPDKRRE